MLRSWSFLLLRAAVAAPPPPGYALERDWIDGAGTWHGILHYYENLVRADGVKGIGSHVIRRLQVDAAVETPTRLRVAIDDAASPRATVPKAVLLPPTPEKHLHCGTLPGGCGVRFAVLRRAPFAFAAVRPDGHGKATLFDSSVEPLVYESQFISLATALLPASRIFGLMESTRRHFSVQPGETRTMWAGDKLAAFFDTNTYGAHPFFISLSADGSAYGVLMLNANGMDISLSQDSSRLTYKLIGGIVNLYIFSGPTVGDVVSQYTEAVGRPAMMPRWALGFHNCRWGYRSLQELEAVTANYTSAGIPITTFWMDIDYMDRYRDFTADPLAFPPGRFAGYVKRLHSRDQRFILILDPGIMIDADYSPYTEALAENVFVKDGFTGAPYTGVVWPGAVHYPDFLHPNTSAWWGRQIRRFLSDIPADGLWVDMNEVSNFCNVDGRGQTCHLASEREYAECPTLGQGGLTGSYNGMCCKGTDGRVVVCRTLDAQNPFDFPPYPLHNMGASGQLQALGMRTLPPSALHHGGVRDYDVHSTYGSLMAKATARALKAARSGRRPFVLSRSTFVGHGAHAAHWLGDNAATWEDLRASITGILGFALLGVPMVGSDICGFLRDTNPELCTRWIQVGAFAPFSRVHNSLGQKPQELYRWYSVAQAAKLVLELRYCLLPYLYTLFYEAHTSGSMVARPLFAVFPGDEDALEVMDRQFMLGDALLITPVLTQDATAVRGYFPKGHWHSLINGQPSVDATASSRWVELATPLERTNVHVRGGTVLPMQREVNTTAPAALHILAALDEHGSAEGRLFFDDGEQPQVGVGAVVAHFKVGCGAPLGCALGGSLTVSGDGDLAGTPGALPRIRSVRILGVRQPPSGWRLSFAANALPWTQAGEDAADGSSLIFEGVDLPLVGSSSLCWRAFQHTPTTSPGAPAAEALQQPRAVGSEFTVIEVAWHRGAPASSRAWWVSVALMACLTLTFVLMLAGALWSRDRGERLATPLL